MLSPNKTSSGSGCFKIGSFIIPPLQPSTQVLRCFKPALTKLFLGSWHPLWKTFFPLSAESKLMVMATFQSKWLGLWPTSAAGTLNFTLGPFLLDCSCFKNWFAKPSTCFILQPALIWWGFPSTNVCTKGSTNWGPSLSYNMLLSRPIISLISQ